MRTGKYRIISAMTLLTLLASCGDSGSNGNSRSNESTEEREEIIPTDGSNIDGLYRATFTTLNSHVNGTIPGSATFLRKENKFYAYVRLFAGGPKAWHPQAVYTGGRCPTMDDDENRDGFIDIVEAEKVLGSIIIPLDANISSQSGGKNFYPLADASGSYHYERITNFQSFLNDLQREDNDLEDNVTKLGPDRGLKIEGKTVLIQGISDTITLPETVASVGRRRSFQTLPIVCGVFKKITTTPGTPDDGVIPGPVAEVVEDQDRPAPEVGEMPEGETGGGTTGTNESERGETPTTNEDGRRAPRGSGAGGYSEDRPHEEENGGGTPGELPEVEPIPEEGSTGGVSGDEESLLF